MALAMPIVLSKSSIHTTSLLSKLSLSDRMFIANKLTSLQNLRQGSAH